MDMNHPLTLTESGLHLQHTFNSSNSTPQQLHSMYLNNRFHHHTNVESVLTPDFNVALSDSGPCIRGPINYCSINPDTRLYSQTDVCDTNSIDTRLIPETNRSTRSQSSNLNRRQVTRNDNSIANQGTEMGLSCSRASYMCRKCKTHGHNIPVKRHKRTCPYMMCNCLKCQLVDQGRKVVARQIALYRDQRSSTSKENVQLSESLTTIATSNEEWSGAQRNRFHLVDSSPTKTTNSSRMHPNQLVQPKFFTIPGNANPPSSKSAGDQLRSKMNGLSTIGPHCRRCRNHSLAVTWKGHKKQCPYRNCPCDPCRLINVRKDTEKILREMVNHGTEDGVKNSTAYTETGIESPSTLNSSPTHFQSTSQPELTGKLQTNSTSTEKTENELTVTTGNFTKGQLDSPLLGRSLAQLNPYINEVVENTDRNLSIQTQSFMFTPNKLNNFENSANNPQLWNSQVVGKFNGVKPWSFNSTRDIRDFPFSTDNSSSIDWLFNPLTINTTVEKKMHHYHHHHHHHLHIRNETNCSSTCPHFGQPEESTNNLQNNFQQPSCRTSSPQIAANMAMEIQNQPDSTDNSVQLRLEMSGAVEPSILENNSNLTFWPHAKKYNTEDMNNKVNCEHLPEDYCSCYCSERVSAVAAAAAAAAAMVAMGPPIGGGQMNRRRPCPHHHHSYGGGMYTPMPSYNRTMPQHRAIQNHYNRSLMYPQLYQGDGFNNKNVDHTYSELETVEDMKSYTEQYLRNTTMQSIPPKLHNSMQPQHADNESQENPNLSPLMYNHSHQQEQFDGPQCSTTSKQTTYSPQYHRLSNLYVATQENRLNLEQFTPDSIFANAAKQDSPSTDLPSSCTDRMMELSSVSTDLCKSPKPENSDCIDYMVLDGNNNSNNDNEKSVGIVDKLPGWIPNTTLHRPASFRQREG